MRLIGKGARSRQLFQFGPEWDFNLRRALAAMRRERSQKKFAHHRPSQMQKAIYSIVLSLPADQFASLFFDFCAGIYLLRNFELIGPMQKINPN